MRVGHEERHAGTGLRSALVIVIAGALLVGCAVPEDGLVQAVDPGRIPYELNATTTSTTAPTTTAPAVDATSTTAGPETTIPVEVVNLFYVAGLQVVPIARLLLSPATAAQVLAALAEGVPPGDPAAGLRSALPSGFVAEVVVERGVARVDLAPTFLTDVPGAEQRLGIAQIVLSLTRRAGIGQVVFTSGGQPQSVPRGRGDLTDPGGAVACEDYANLLPAGYSC
ncbi:MAG: GerMN domain-containing protein [Ilumatobacteraceae bacterium]